MSEEISAGENIMADAGNRLDLTQLVQCHQSDIWRYVRYLGASVTEADDLTQETFLAVAKKPFEQRSKPETTAYLRTTARNQLLMFRRKQQQEVNTVNMESAELVWAELAGNDGSLEEYLDALDVCLEKLEGRARQAVELQYRAHASRAAIAIELEMKPEGVKTLLRRSRKLLRNCIERRTGTHSVD